MHPVARPPSTRFLAIAALGCLLVAGLLFQLSARATPSGPILLETMRPDRSR